MTVKLERIEYQHGMLDGRTKPESLSKKVWVREAIPNAAHVAITEENLLELGGEHGNQDLGSPVEYDHLLIVYTDRTIEITVYNRGITLLMTDDERIRRIHRFIGKLVNSEKRGLYRRLFECLEKSCFS